MKKLITILFLFAFTINAQETKQQDFWKHYTAGVIVGGLSYTAGWEITKNRWWAFTIGNVTTAGIAIAWEYYVSPSVSGKDIRNTILGSLTFTTIVLPITGPIHRKKATMEQLMEADDPEWSLDNEFINKSINLN